MDLFHFFALGEGWHNWHHVYPWDYSTSEYGIWQRWNPTKLLIDIFAAFGLVWDRKRAVETWKAAKARMAKSNGAIIASEYLNSAKNVLCQQQQELSHILDSARECFNTQQTELATLLENAKKNLEIESLMDNSRKIVELQQAEFTALIDSAKMLFESQQKELASMMEGVSVTQFK